MALTGQAIYNMVNGAENQLDFCNRLAAAINTYLEVRLPANSVVVEVNDPAVPDIGVLNSSLIPCETSGLDDVDIPAESVVVEIEHSADLVVGNLNPAPIPCEVVGS